MTAAAANCVDRGLLLRDSGSCLELTPPLITTKAQIDDIMAIVKDGLDATYKDLAKLDKD